jgi:hypothetical protein
LACEAGEAVLRVRALLRDASGGRGMDACELAARACLRRSGLAGADDGDGRRLRSVVRQRGSVQQMQLS